MSRRSKKKKNNPNHMREASPRIPWHADLHPETKKGAAAIVCFVIAIVLALSYVGKGGTIGNFTFQSLTWLLGKGYFFAPVTLILMGGSLLVGERRKIVGTAALGGSLFLIMCLAVLHIALGADTGGVIGSIVGGTLVSLFDFWASIVISLGTLAISLLIMLNVPLFRKREGSEENETEEKIDAVPAAAALIETIASTLQKTKEAVASAPAPAEAAPVAVAAASSVKDESSIAIRKLMKKIEYAPPSLDLLQGDRGTPSSGDIRANANIIKRTLENFGIDVDMSEVAVGPTVTQYTLKPAEGVKLSRITALHNDLSLALAAHPIRIEAPIPGKSLVGIEVPNRSIALVGLRSLIEHKTFQEAQNPLFLALGRDVTGAAVYTDLARMPHLLISGATGSGKSVAAHVIMTSLLYRNPPEMLRFIIVDPKRVELSIYNDIPHLLTPVITDPKKTVQALRWAAKEMDRRYTMLAELHARDIVSYNSQISKKPDGEILPYIVIMVDELADLMAVFPREVESSIIRLAQMARAVGIHLIVATQRPSVEVITGLIKANITSRMAFQVASQIDSRTILDASGAEKLLGNGDMLFVSGDSGKPRRIQGAFISEQEVKRIVGFLREEAEAPEYNESILSTDVAEGGHADGDAGSDDDPLYEDAKAIILEAGKASASYLQRRLRVGYARAARLLDLLEGNGVIGPADGAKPRDVLIHTDAEGAEILEN